MAEHRGGAVPPVLVAVEGHSGIGKSAISRALARSLGALWIAEAFDRVRPRLDLEVRDAAALLRVERRLLLEETARYREATDARRRGRVVVLDTGFLGPVSYAAGLARIEPRFRPALRPLGRDAIRSVRRASLGLADVTVHLRLDGPETLRRIERSWRRHPARWRERHRRVGRIERRLLRTALRPLGPGRVIDVDARGAPGAIVRAVRRALGGRPRGTGPSPRLALAAVRTLLRGASPEARPRGAPRKRPRPAATVKSGTPSRRPRPHVVP